MPKNFEGILETRRTKRGGVACRQCFTVERRRGTSDCFVSAAQIRRIQYDNRRIFDFARSRNGGGFGKCRRCRTERIFLGLAATAQIVTVAVCFGICLIFWFPAMTDQREITIRIAGLDLNELAIIVASLITYAALGVGKRLQNYPE